MTAFVVLTAIVAAGAWYVTRSFETKLLSLLAVLPFLGWLQVHAPAVPWSIVVTGLTAGLAVHAVAEPPRRSHAVDRTGAGLTAVVLAYAAVVTAQTFSPDLPSATIGLRGLRLVLEPMALFFVGVEAARRPALRRRALAVVLVTGAVVIAYAFRQWLAGFDAAEIRAYRRSFPIAIRERRIFSTLPGASALGHQLGLVALAAGAWILVRPRRWLSGTALIVAGLFAVLLTGQRGVQLAVFAGGVVAVGLALRRPRFRRTGARAGQVLTVVAALALALVVLTPVQDRRAAADPSASAFESARIKIALLRQGTHERSFELRSTRLGQTIDALTERPLGAGTGLHLLVEPGRSAETTFLGTSGFGDDTDRTPLEPLPGEMYWYTLASEGGVPALALWSALALFGIVAAGGVVRRHPDDEVAATALVAGGYFVIVVLDSFAVDAMTAMPVAAWFWLFLGLVGRWAHARHDPVTTGDRRRANAVGAGV